MDQRSPVGSQDLKKDQSDAPQSQPSQAIHQPIPTIVHPAVNGVLSHVNGVNGASTNGISSSTPSRALDAGHDETAAKAPQLDQSWRQEPSANIRLGTLLEREAQDCFTSLHGLIGDLSGQRIPQDASQNGAPPPNQTKLDTNEQSIAKRKRILDFAGHQRDRWIRTLVLSDWARQEHDMAKLIDINLFQKKLMNSHDGAAWSIAHTKRSTQGAKMPNPNIEGALELMSTGKASWVPTMGYIQPKRMPASQLLRTLQDMNVALATRLNLHETIPPHMRDFTIADGRATFRVKDEFEVDISIADEDPSSPFYFIDLRLSFQPTGEIANEQLRRFVEGKSNEMLASKGLQGCYDFLHSFVLTHKLNVLKAQFADLVRGRWFDCIKLESMRRTFVIQYWATQPGAKSWLEFGVSSGTVPTTKSRLKTTSVLMVRWFRNGVEVIDEPLNVDWCNINLERTLLMVSEKHSAWLLNSIRARILEIGGQSSAVITSMTTAEDGSKLSLELPAIRQPLVAHIEPATGQYSISPPNPITYATEQQLNTLQIDPAKKLASLIATLMQFNAVRDADMLGWERIRDLSRQPNIATLFGKDVVQMSLWKCSKIWSDEWSLAATFGFSGCKWWVVKLLPATHERGRIIASTRILTVDRSAKISRHMLLQIERTAVAEISYAVLAQQLDSLHIQHRLERRVNLKSTSDAGSGNVPGRNANSSTIMVRFPQLMQQDKRWKSWAAEPVRITHLGGDTSEESPATVLHEIRLTLHDGTMKRLQGALRRARDHELVVNETGGLALRLRSQFGIPFVDQIHRKLRSIERLDRFAQTLEASQIKITAISLSKMAFIYSKQPLLGAEISFPAESQMLQAQGSVDTGLSTPTVKLSFEPPETNPHTRIRALLQDYLNQGISEKRNNGTFENFIQILLLTKPLLLTFQELGIPDPISTQSTLHIHTPTQLSLKYRHPFPPVAIDLRTRMRREEGGKATLMWQVRRSAKADEALEPGFREKLKTSWKAEAQPWIATDNGAGAIGGNEDIAVLIKKTDALVKENIIKDSPQKPEQSTKPQTVDAKKPPPPKTKQKAKPRQGDAKVKKEQDVIEIE